MESKNWSETAAAGVCADTDAASSRIAALALSTLVRMLDSFSDTLLPPAASLYTFCMPREEYRCAHRLRVRWAEVDMQKVVFNAHYLTYIDTAIAEYWREIGFPYPEGYVDRFGADMFLRKATVEYLDSARYDDELTVCCRVATLGRTSMTMSASKPPTRQTLTSRRASPPRSNAIAAAASSLASPFSATAS